MGNVIERSEQNTFQELGSMVKGICLFIIMLYVVLIIPLYFKDIKLQNNQILEQLDIIQLQTATNY